MQGSGEGIYILPDSKLLIKPLKKGRYIVAVSGGVDSTVLLDLLSKQPDLDLIAAHFNHGIRGDSENGEVAARTQAQQLGLIFETGYGKLGADASEERARNSRYAFLEAVRRKYDAQAVITAHHQDDLIETALINVIRGTGRKGLTSMLDNKSVIRPMLSIAKRQIIGYALEQNINWDEDSSNNDSKYLRNRIRKRLKTDKKNSDLSQLVEYIEKVAKVNNELDDSIATISQNYRNDSEIDRSLYTLLPPNIAKELLVYWLRDMSLNDFDSKTIERLYMKLKTAPIKSRHEVDKGWWLFTDRDKAYFSNNRVERLI